MIGKLRKLIRLKMIVHMNSFQVTRSPPSPGTSQHAGEASRGAFSKKVNSSACFFSPRSTVCISQFDQKSPGSLPEVSWKLYLSLWPIGQAVAPSGFHFGRRFLQHFHARSLGSNFHPVTTPSQTREPRRIWEILGDLPEMNPNLPKT